MFINLIRFQLKITNLNQFFNYNFYNESKANLLANLVCQVILKIQITQDFPGGTVVKNPPVNAGDTGSIPGLEDPTCLGAAKPVRHNY